MLGVISNEGLMRIIKSQSLGKALLATAGVSSLSSQDFSTMAFKLEGLKIHLSKAILVESLVPKHDKGIFSNAINLSEAPTIDMENLEILEVCSISGGENIAN